MSNSIQQTRTLNSLRDDFSDLKFSKHFRKQRKIDVDIKKSKFNDEFSKETDGHYKFRCVDVVNYNENYDVTYIKTNRSKISQIQRLLTSINLYENEKYEQCVVFFERYTNSKIKEEFNQKQLKESEQFFDFKNEDNKNDIF